jgi:hypothetical protein
MDKKRLNIIRSIRDSLYHLECEGCGYYDCDGDWHWKSAQNQCWDKYTTEQLEQIYSEYIEVENQDDDD